MPPPAGTDRSDAPYGGLQLAVVRDPSACSDVPDFVDTL